MKSNWIVYYFMFLFISTLNRSHAQCTSVTPVEAVVNGNFDNGFTSNFFIEPGYEYRAPVSGSSPGTYQVSNNDGSGTFNPGFFSGVYDHTRPGVRGNMLMIDAKNELNTVAWGTNVNVIAGQTYFFTAFVTGLLIENLPKLRFEIKGEFDGGFNSLGSAEFSPTNNKGEWIRIYATWTSGTNTKATIRIVDNQTNGGNGNDFALDDISFKNGCNTAFDNFSPNLGPDISLCNQPGNKATLNSGIPAGSTTTFKWTKLPNESLSSTFSTLDVTTAGTYQVCVIKDACAKSSSVVVTSPKLNPGTIAGTQQICNGSTPATISSSTPASGGSSPIQYQWEQSSNDVSWSDVSGEKGLTFTPVSTLSQGTYFRRKATGGYSSCETASTPSIKISVYNSLSKPSISAGQTICSNIKPADLKEVTATTGGKGNYISIWESDPGTGTFASTGISTKDFSYPATLAASSLTIFKYRKKVNDDCGIVYSDPVDITVKPQIVFSTTLNAVTDICKTDPNPVNFTSVTSPAGIGTGSYGWTFNNIADNTSITDKLSRSASTLSDGNQIQVTVKPSADVCPSQPSYSSNIVKLKVADKIIPTISEAQPVSRCAGSPVTLTASITGGGTTPTYQWEVNSGPIVNNANYYTYTPINNDNIKVTVITSEACKSNFAGEDRASASVTLKVNPLLTPTVVIKADNNSTCENESAKFTITSKTNEGANPVYKWYVDNQLQPVSSHEFESKNLKGSPVVKLEMLSNVACVNTSTNPASAQTQVKVNPNLTPATGLFSSLANAICSGESITFNAAKSSSDTSNAGTSPKFEWYVGTQLVSSNPDYTTNQLKDGDIVSIVLKSSLTCLAQPSASKKITMFVKTPALKITGNTTFCSDNMNSSLTVDDAGTGTNPITGESPVYTWHNVGGGVLGAGKSISVAGLLDKEIVTVKMKPAYNCSAPLAKDNKTIIVFEKPIFIINASAPEICPGESAKLEGLVSTTLVLPFSYIWKNDHNQTVGNTKNLMVSEEGTYQLKVINGLPSCSTTVVKSVKVQFMAINAGPDKSIFLGENTVLEALSNGAYTYQWTPVNGNFSPQILQPLVSPTLDTRYKLQATSSIGCKAEAEVTVFVKQPVSIPNVFSPNGDGLNDNWVISGLESYPSANLKVFNRWGNLVFDGHGGETSRWEGTHNGKPLPVGTFYYILDLGENLSRDRYFSGSVTIIE